MRSSVRVFFLTSFIHLFCFTSAFAVDIVKVGIAVDAHDALFVSGNSPYCLLNADGSTVDTIFEKGSIRFKTDKEYIELKTSAGFSARGKRFTLKAVNSSAFFRFRSSTVAYPYDDDLQVFVSSGGFTAVNLVKIDKYVSGVVESEAGDNSNLEFLKVQSVLVRTFLESHVDRHARQGFMVCDKVHCQVYHARSRFNNLIGQAIDKTRGMVIKDAAGKIITTVYHSNCGGQTMDANDLWKKPVSYLKSVQDSFCVRNGSRTWEKLIDRIAWKEYLGKKFNCLVYDDMPDSAYSFNQEVRKNYLLFDGNLLALNTVRNDWKLNSTFFNIIPMGDKILIKGKGHGHGVGLCQSGAMQMAECGYKMNEIISFYYGSARAVMLK